MDDKQDNPSERAFTRHPDHPPGEPDQPAEGNKELLRDGGEAQDAGSGGEEAEKSPGDKGTNLPGYG